MMYNFKPSGISKDLYTENKKTWLTHTCTVRGTSKRWDVGLIILKRKWWTAVWGCYRENVTVPWDEMFSGASGATLSATHTHFFMLHLPPTQQPVNNEFSYKSERWVCLVTAAVSRPASLKALPQAFQRRRHDCCLRTNPVHYHRTFQLFRTLQPWLLSATSV